MSCWSFCPVLSPTKLQAFPIKRMICTIHMCKYKYIYIYTYFHIYILYNTYCIFYEHIPKRTHTCFYMFLYDKWLWFSKLLVISPHPAATGLTPCFFGTADVYKLNPCLQSMGRLWSLRTTSNHWETQWIDVGFIRSNETSRHVQFRMYNVK